MRTPHFSLHFITMTLVSIFLLATGCDQTQTNSDSVPSPSPSSAATVDLITPKLNPTQTATIGGHTFNVQIAKTETEQAQGLSSISSIKNTEGMLFLFNPPSQPTFWMKNMRFPIDILWIRNNKVIAINENLPIPTVGKGTRQLPLYVPPTDIDAALEIRSGMAQSYNLHTGDSVAYDDTKN